MDQASRSKEEEDNNIQVVMTTCCWGLRENYMGICLRGEGVGGDFIQIQRLVKENGRWIIIFA